MRTFDEINKDLRQALGTNDAEALLHCAKEIDDLGTPQADASAHFARGWACLLRGDNSAALEHYHHALSLYEELGDRSSVASSNGNLGSVYYNSGEAPAALEHFHRALALYEELGNGNGVANVTANIGNIHNDTGDYPAALEHYHRALALYEELGNSFGSATVIGNIGIVHQRTGDNPAALEHFRRALALHEELGNRAGVASVNGNLGTVHDSTDEHPVALEHFNRALSIYQELSDLNGVARVTGQMLSAYVTMNSDLEAQARLITMDTMQINEPMVRIIREQQRATLQERSGELDAAVVTLKHALDEAIEHGLRSHAAGVHKALRELALKRNDFADYIKHNDEYQRITEEIRGKEATQKMAMQDADRKMVAERRERDKERAILYSTLPSHVADRLIRGEDVSGDHFDHASVMFLDVVGFTTNSRDLEPRVVTELLDDVFNTFDELCDKHNVTKIKTIGDAYLAVAFPSEEYSTEKNIASVALGIQQLQFTWPNKSPLQFRIGLHSGPVVAGVIGKQRLQYDVWGDTVNVASRMESTSEPNRIHVSEAFVRSLALARDDIQPASARDGDAVIPSVSEEPGTWHLALRGETDIKGKGTMKTFWLEGA